MIEINDRRSLIGPLRSLLATLFAVAALHAENASTRDQRLSIEKPIKSCQGFLLTKSNGLFSATRLFRQPLLHAITAGREFAFLGKTPRNGISSRKRARVKMGSTVQAARYFSQSLSALGRFSESLKQGCRCYTATTTVLMGVPYRRFPIRTSGNGGTFSAPGFSRIWAPIAHNTAINREYPGTALRVVQSPSRCVPTDVSLAGHFRFCIPRPRRCAVSRPRHYSALRWQ